MQFNLTTKRLLLAPLQMEHAENFYAYRSDSITNKYQGWIPYALEDAKYFIKNKVAKKLNLKETWYQLVILKKENHDVIGDLGIHFLSKETTCEIGCTIAKSEQRKGYASEALKATIDFLFTDLNKEIIYAYTHPENLASQKMLIQLGFNSTCSNKDDDDLLFTIDYRDWQKNCKSKK